jgi:hypothetical protein
MAGYIAHLPVDGQRALVYGKAAYAKGAEQLL